MAVCAINVSGPGFLKIGDLKRSILCRAPSHPASPALCPQDIPGLKKTF